MKPPKPQENTFFDIEEGDALVVEKKYTDYEVGSGGPIDVGIKFKGVKDIWWKTVKED